MLDDAFEHFLGALVRGEEFDAKDAAFFSVHVAFCDAVHGFDGVFEAGTVGVFLEVLFEAFEGVVVFAESFKEGSEFESGGFCLWAERREFDDGAVGVGCLARLPVGNIISGGFEGGIGVEFSFAEKVDEPTFAFFVGDVCGVRYGGQQRQQGD